MLLLCMTKQFLFIKIHSFIIESLFYYSEGVCRAKYVQDPLEKDLQHNIQKEDLLLGQIKILSVLVSTHMLQDMQIVK